MYKAKNYITAFFFTGLISLPLCFIIILQWQQWSIKGDAKERLEREALQTITLPAGKLYWEKPGKEAIIDGRWFDVKELSDNGSTITLTGLFDEEETRIVKLLDDKAGNSSQSFFLIRLLLFGQCFASLLIIFLTTHFTGSAGVIHSIILLLHYPNPFLSIISPPPRVSTC